MEPRAGIADRLTAMIRIPTVSAEKATRGTRPFTEFVEVLAELYPLVHARLAAERIEEFGLVYTWSPTGPTDADPVVLMAHYDVVPVAGQEPAWSLPPFEGRSFGDEVWGRGALDDKGALCALLDAVENLLAAGWAPQRTVLLCLGPDEETHGGTGRAIANTLHARGLNPWLVLDEGGAVTDIPFPGVDGHFAMVGLAEKGVMTVELSAAGAGGHASAPTGLTAVGRVARAVARVNRNPFDVRLPRTVAEMLTALAGHARPRLGPVYRLAAKAGWVTARLLLAAGGAEGAAMVRTSLAPTMLSGGSSANVLPSSAKAMLNLRVNVGETTTGVLARLKRVIADPDVTVRLVEGDEPTAESPSDNAQFALIAAAVAASYPGVPTIPYLTMAATDGRHWHRFAPAVYRFAPLLITGAQRGQIHGIDERVGIDSLERAERFYRALLTGLPA